MEKDQETAEVVVEKAETAVDRFRKRRDVAAEMAAYHRRTVAEARDRVAEYEQEVADLDAAISAMTGGVL